ncbi:MAG: hypothetical protein P3A32_03870 [Gemmatimonadota bacterium]|nr:hypothetical protein [Gemmatimonadota bacterium]MDQ8146619.1 hypothetical protein [Gemmatimonadota bacterium]MDQ8148949.1 hypothetical protein [Gemmatimonadota bacterium]MDQ8175973.1 hypothetical protein [Gemmatimonadota bacterium]
MHWAVRSLLRAVTLGAVLVPSLGALLGAQEQAPGVLIELPATERLADDGPTVRAQGLLTSPNIATLVAAGFPARLRFRLELWTEGRLVDELQRAVTWDVVVRRLGGDERYEVTQLVGAQRVALGAYRVFADAAGAAERGVRVPLRAPADGRSHYFVATVEVEALSVTDLDEVNRWLRGELEPALRGDRDAAPALGRGLRTLATRLLGGDRRRYEARSRSFRAISRTTVSP